MDRDEHVGARADRIVLAEELADPRASASTLWPVRLSPQADELLTSWLIRLSAAHGLALKEFYSAVWLGRRLTLVDIDANAPDDVLHTLATSTGTPIRRVEATTLGAYDPLFGPGDRGREQHQWLFANRVTTRNRRHGGQYCPECLAADERPYWRRHWRLAWTVACPIHRRLLASCCPTCWEPVELRATVPRQLQRLERLAPDAMSIEYCFDCGADRRDTRRRDPRTRSAPPPEAPIFEQQARLIEGLQLGMVAVPQRGPVPLVDYCRGLRFRVWRYFSTLSDYGRELACHQHRLTPFRLTYGTPRPKLVTQVSPRVRWQLMQLAMADLDAWLLQPDAEAMLRFGARSELHLWQIANGQRNERTVVPVPPLRLPELPS